MLKNCVIPNSCYEWNQCLDSGSACFSLFFFLTNQSGGPVSGKYLTRILQRLQKPLQIKLFAASQRKRNEVLFIP